MIAQIGKTSEHPSNSFPGESLQIISRMLQTEKDVQPLISAISALGHLSDPATVALISSYRSHESSGVRFSVAFALGSFPDNPDAIPSLLELSRDTAADVRDWATFALGVLGSTDTPEIRAALLARLNDQDDDARQEAVVGLAKRKDLRVLPALKEMLHLPGPPYRATEAASLLLDNEDADPEWSADRYIRALTERCP